MIANLLAATLIVCAANDTIVSLDDVTITGQSKRDYLMRSSQTSVQVNRDFLENNFAGSLMQTLEGVPGVKAMSIGSGQSKPTIRGLGFNRLAVTEDGIKLISYLPDRIKSPSYTAEWENRLAEIAKGETSAHVFMECIETEVKQMVAEYSTKDTGAEKGVAV